MASLRFSYTQRNANAGAIGYAPLLPLTLENSGRAMAVTGLLDTGAAVSVLPYSVGLGLGFIWEAQPVAAQLSGNLSAVSTRLLLATGTVSGFAPVRLAFAWAQTDSVPLLLGQVNFFAEFDVCFYRSQLAFEITPKPSSP